MGNYQSLFAESEEQSQLELNPQKSDWIAGDILINLCLYQWK